jgi:cytochrome c5
MSDPHSSNESEGLIKTPTQLIVVVVLAFVVPIAAIFTIIHFVMADQPRADPAASNKAVAERIKPVGSTPDIEKGPSPVAPVPAPVAAAPAATAGDAAAPAASGGNGKAVYDASCQACHTPGVAGAPKLGDKAAWAPRIGAGAAGLHASALKGKNAMPAKGGNLSLSDADVKAAVDYMIAQSK